MRIVKVNATASTNTYLREYCRNTGNREDILLWTDHQFAGRGQRGAVWESEPFKNLTLSVFRSIKLLKIEQQFYITMAASLAIYELLEKLKLQRIHVKWPNDILTGNRKICGILIESLVKQSKLNAVIIGIGLNVNQTTFQHAPRASSIQLETGKEHKLDDLILSISVLFQKYVTCISMGDLDLIKADYESKLFKKDKPALFSDRSGHRFNGIIRGVSKQGKLLLQHEDDRVYTYDTKEIKMYY